MGTQRLLFAISGAVLLLQACGGQTGRLEPLVPERTRATAGIQVPAAQTPLPAPAVRTPAPAPAAAAQPAARPASAAPSDAGQPAAPAGITAQSGGATFVGGKVREMQDDLRRLQESVAAEGAELDEIQGAIDAAALSYHGRIAAMRSRLQRGTTRGNPELTREWAAAQTDLEAVRAGVEHLNDLSARVASDAALSAYLLESARASYGISGATEEDHRQLSEIEREVNRSVLQIDRLLGELSDDIRRQSRYVISERSNLTTLALAIKDGEYLGPSLGQAAPAGQGAAAPATSPVESIDARQPLVVIRFDRPDVKYRQALYTAVREVLDRKPDARFDLVAVSALGDVEAQSALDAVTTRRNAESVLRAMVDMGLSADRMTVSATTTSTGGNEVRLYVR